MGTCIYRENSVAVGMSEVGKEYEVSVSPSHWNLDSLVTTSITEPNSRSLTAAGEGQLPFRAGHFLSPFPQWHPLLPCLLTAIEYIIIYYYI